MNSNEWAQTTESMRVNHWDIYWLEVPGSICICKNSNECKRLQDQVIVQEVKWAFKIYLNSKFYSNIES